MRLIQRIERRVLGMTAEEAVAQRRALIVLTAENAANRAVDRRLERLVDALERADADDADADDADADEGRDRHDDRMAHI